MIYCQKVCSVLAWLEPRREHCIAVLYVIAVAMQVYHDSVIAALVVVLPVGTDMESMDSESQALAVRYIQKPQDGHADTVAKLSFKPSYVTYNPVTIKNVQGFFKTGEVFKPSLYSCAHSALMLHALLCDNLSSDSQTHAPSAQRALLAG